MQDAQFFNYVDSGLNIQSLIEYSDFQISLGTSMNKMLQIKNHSAFQGCSDFFNKTLYLVSMNLFKDFHHDQPYSNLTHSCRLTCPHIG